MIERKKVKGRIYYKYWRKGLRGEWHQVSDLARLNECIVSSHALHQRILKALKTGENTTIYKLMTTPAKEIKQQNNYSKREKKEALPVDWSWLYKKWVTT